MCDKVRSANNQSSTNENKRVNDGNKHNEISTNSKNKNHNESPGAIQNLLKRLPELDSCFHIHGKIGEGTFSNVYLASLKGFSSDKKFAIKHLIPTCHPKRMTYELDCLNLLGGKDNVVSCEMSMRQADCVLFIMPYLQHQRFADYVLEMNVKEARLYMKNLLLALRRVHLFNIIHRDIKPSNFLYNRESKQFLLVDFGLAQKVNENEDRNRLKTLITKPTATKRKREDDDVENVAAKRSALQTLSNDISNKLAGRTATSPRYPRQPLSIQQQKCQQLKANLLRLQDSTRTTKGSKPLDNPIKRQPLTSNSSNVINHNSQKQKQTFQSLLPQKVSSVDQGARFVRVQNSQVQAGSLFPRPTAPVRRKEVCDCKGKAQVCHICLTRKTQYAPRAGTPGFRPPEVLLKYPNQTTAVDMWSAGVIMLCILSGCYPFFRSPDDVSALSEIISVFGATAITELAKKLGRNLICSEKRKPLNLRLLCEGLRRRKLSGQKSQSQNTKDEGLSSSAQKAERNSQESSNKAKESKQQPLCPECHASSLEFVCLCEDKCTIDISNTFFPSSAFDLLSKLLDVDPYTRISAEKALEHPFITAAD